MENKREIIVKKIEKYGFNVRILNIAIAIMVAIFTITFFIVYSKEKAEYDLQNSSISARLKEIEQNQLNTIFSNVTPNNGSVNKKEVEQPMFKNAKEAVLYAFDKFNSYSFLETETTGYSVAEVLGQTVKVLIQGKSARWDDGLEYEQNMMYETNSNYGQSKATESLFLNGKFTRTGSNLRYSNGTLSADFSGPFKKANSELTKKPMLVINSQTVLQNMSFSFVRDKNNKIMYYTAGVRLDTDETVKYYGQSIKEQGGTSFPIFSQLEITCNIDRDGNLISYTGHEKMTLTKTIVAEITTTTTNDYVTVIKSYNQLPSIPKTFEIA